MYFDLNLLEIYSQGCIYIIKNSIGLDDGLETNMQWIIIWTTGDGIIRLLDEFNSMTPEYITNIRLHIKGSTYPFVRKPGATKTVSQPSRFW